MKKISLKNLDFASEEMLTKEQLKQILGGYSESSDDGGSGAGGCATYCPDSDEVIRINNCSMKCSAGPGYVRCGNDYQTCPVVITKKRQ